MPLDPRSLPIGALAIYAVMSVVSFVLYGIDKKRARAGAWRISEGMLHASELFGGWPGAFVAQQMLRHKRQKRSYMLVFWAIVGMHAAVWAWWFGAFS